MQESGDDNAPWKDSDSENEGHKKRARKKVKKEDSTDESDLEFFAKLEAEAMELEKLRLVN